MKEINKTFSPELLANLIKKRIEFPNSTGPYVRLHQDEVATDIINALITEDDEYRKKLTPAVGLLLYKMMHDELGESHEILRGVFAIIKDCKLTECDTLVYNWLNNKKNVLVSGTEPIEQRWKQTYREGMMAYAQIQPKDVVVEHWWFNIWKEGSIYWWAAAFTGLRIQNPNSAADELPLLVSRNTDKVPFLLVGMWNDLNSRGILEDAIRCGLNDNTGWAGLGLNMILEKLNDADKNIIMLNLKSLNRTPEKTEQAEKIYAL
jgi:hypothetical protein